MPFQLKLDTSTSECKGLLIIDSEKMVRLEGTCKGSQLELFEFDEHARVLGSFVCEYENGKGNGYWSNNNGSVKYDISMLTPEERTGRLQLYKLKDDYEKDMLILWPDRLKLAILDRDSELLFWQDYSCPHAPYACTYESGNNVSQTISLSNKLVSVGSQLYERTADLNLKSRTVFGFEYYYNFVHPSINDEKFTSFIDDLLSKYEQRFLNSIVISDEQQPEDRFKYRASGDFVLTLLSEDIISGFLTFNSSVQPRLETIAFSYDRAKKRFHRIQDIWENDFDYRFFLTRAIENKKRGILNSEDPIIRSVLKDEPFTHFVLSFNGIVFFTDYHSIYGRRSVLLPYREIEGFIKDKSLRNFINGKM